jgi:hypothetical protein
MLPDMAAPPLEAPDGHAAFGGGKPLLQSQCVQQLVSLKILQIGLGPSIRRTVGRALGQAAFFLRHVNLLGYAAIVGYCACKARDSSVTFLWREGASELHRSCRFQPSNRSIAKEASVQGLGTGSKTRAYHTSRRCARRFSLGLPRPCLAGNPLGEDKGIVKLTEKILHGLEALHRGGAATEKGAPQFAGVAQPATAPANGV